MGERSIVDDWRFITPSHGALTPSSDTVFACDRATQPNRGRLMHFSWNSCLFRKRCVERYESTSLTPTNLKTDLVNYQGRGDITYIPRREETKEHYSDYILQAGTIISGSVLKQRRYHQFPFAHRCFYEWARNCITEWPKKVRFLIAHRRKDHRPGSQN